MKRRTAREKAIQTLYQVEMAKLDWQEALSNVLDGNESDAYLEQALAGIHEHIADIDQSLRLSLQNWKLERLAHVDRAILRLGVYELRYREDVPQQVVINEAIELAKIFGTDQSSKFINGVLSHILKQGVQ
jgi:N utilization substance protein B